MPLQATSGAASYDAFGGGVPVVPTYIEDVMSTWLYTGTGASQTITNGIDLSGKGGMVWLKTRNVAGSNYVQDTARGATQSIYTNSTAASGTANILSSFTSSGFVDNNQFSNGDTIASWTFRKQPKFFDVLTYTGTGSNTTIAHSLGSVPACIIVKRTDTTGAWQVYHRSLANTEYLVLNTTAAKATGATRWNSTTPTSTVFSLGTDATVNASGGTYVAYLFAHDAGGFGLTGTDNVISCGSFTTNGTGNATVNLGYEPQWLLVKNTSATEDWLLIDSMRGWVVGGNSRYLRPNLSNAEPGTALGNPTATGFDFVFSSSATYIYIAIRRGPMKVPTSGTSVFNTVLWTGNETQNREITGVGFSADFVEGGTRGVSTTFARLVVDRLRGVNKYVMTDLTNTEASGSDLVSFNNDGITVNYADSGSFNNASNIYGHFFKRAPSFFDEVCYTGTGANATITHNLAAVPELMIVKSRTATWNWAVYHSALGNTQFTLLDSDGGPVTQSTVWNNTSPTSSVFTVGSAGYTNASAGKYVAYLFATCAGVSKVGSYTGTGTTKQIDCGFTGGARFVLIKRSEDGFSGDWYVWDSARGIVSGNDPYLLLNSTAAEVTSTDYIDTYSAGFEISSTAPAAINASGGSFIFLAIA